MSGWAEERQILEGWFAKQWANPALSVPTPPFLQWKTATCPVFYEGQVSDIPPAGGPFIEMFVIGSPSGTQVSLGTPALERYVGIIQFTISCPISNSVGPNEMAREIGDNLDKMFKGRRFQTSAGRIRCRVPGLHTMGQINDRWVAVLSVPYLRDEFADIPPPVGLA